MKCELCGDKEAGFKQVVEGAVLFVCQNCKGKDAQPVQLSERAVFKPKKIQEKELVPNFGSLIRDARQKIGIGKGDLASKIGIKESNLARIETEDLEPTDAEIDKLEKMLKVKLKEAPSPVAQKKEKVTDTTLGDVVELK